MFKFNFDVEDADEGFPDDQTAVSDSADSDKNLEYDAFKEVMIDELLDSLPNVMSFSQMSIACSGREEPVVLARRDLFDAKFQLIAEGTDSDPALQFMEDPSDLVPSIYEGGLKTWECSLDLVDYLVQNESDVSGRKLLEIGCGTAIPSCYLFQKILSDPITNDSRTEIHLQDYNESVLKLVTLPNLLLAWYTSTASRAYRDVLSETITEDDAAGADLNITAELRAAFLDSLRAKNISLRFFSGSWATYDLDETGGPYSIILTSETIYRTDTLPSLIKLMKQGSRTDTLDVATSRLSIAEEAGSPRPLCLVAAKVLYFGVGGGITEFVNSVEPDGRVETVWEKKTGVGREILRVNW